MTAPDDGLVRCDWAVGKPGSADNTAYAKAMEAGGMRGTRGGKRAPNQAVIVVFKPRPTNLAGPEGADETKSG